MIRPQKASTSFAFSEVDRLLQTDDPPRAVITLGTRMLAGVLKAISSRGLRIPEDLSIICVGDNDNVRCAEHAITATHWAMTEPRGAARKSAWEGQSESGSVDLGGRRVQK